MPIQDEKFPWESYTEMVAFIGMVYGLLASLNLLLVVLDAAQIGAIASLIFLGVMIARKYGSGGKIVLQKS